MNEGNGKVHALRGHEGLDGEQRYSRTLDCEQLGLRVFYKTSKNFEGILT
jgi:hypothetical protein